MQKIALADLPHEELLPGFKARVVHSQNMTFVHWDIAAGYLLPEHSHLHEQVATVLEGTFEFTVNGEVVVLEKDNVAIIPPHSKHSGRAVTDCKILAAFYPLREDYVP